MALLARTLLVLNKPFINLKNIRVKLGPLDRRRASVPRRFRIRQHLRDTIPADPEIPGDLTPTQPVFKVNATNLQIQIRGEYLQAL
jgi:hypothetical protein